MIVLEKERRARNISQRKLMQLTGVDSSYLSRAERMGMRLYPGQASRVAEALGWDGDPADLFKEVDADAADARE
ncbi:helix-turn-helix transcriptional regulator [Slackia piriformis]|nr:helix-turn-helix transcriptional regulator [Slackia piriformis]